MTETSLGFHVGERPLSDSGNWVKLEKEFQERDKGKLFTVLTFSNIFKTVISMRRINYTLTGDLPWFAGARPPLGCVADQYGQKEAEVQGFLKGLD